MKKPFNLRKKAANPAAIGVPQPYNAPNKQYHSPTIVSKPPAAPAPVFNIPPIKEQEPVAPVGQPVEQQVTVQPEVSGVEFGPEFEKAVQQYLASFIVPGNPFAKKPAPLPQGWDDRNSETDPGSVFEEFSFVAKKILENRPYKFDPAVIEKIIDSCVGQGNDWQKQQEHTNIKPKTEEELDQPVVAADEMEKAEIADSLVNIISKDKIDKILESYVTRGCSDIKIKEPSAGQLNVYPIEYITAEGKKFSNKYKSDKAFAQKVNSIIETDDFAAKECIRMVRKFTGTQINIEEAKKAMISSMMNPRGLSRLEKLNIGEASKTKITKHKDFTSGFFAAFSKKNGLLHEKYLPADVSVQDIKDMAKSEKEEVIKSLSPEENAANAEKNKAIRSKLNTIINKLIDDGNEDLIRYLSLMSASGVANALKDDMSEKKTKSYNKETTDGGDLSGEISENKRVEQRPLTPEESIARDIEVFAADDNQEDIATRIDKHILSGTFSSLDNSIKEKAKSIPPENFIYPEKLGGQENIEERSQLKSLFKECRNLDILQIISTALNVQVDSLIKNTSDIGRKVSVVTRVDKNTGEKKKFRVIQNNNGEFEQEIKPASLKVDVETGQVKNWQNLVNHTYTYKLYKDIVDIKKEILRVSKTTDNPASIGRDIISRNRITDPVLVKMLSDPDFINRTRELKTEKNIDLAYITPERQEEKSDIFSVSTGIKGHNELMSARVDLWPRLLTSLIPQVAKTEQAIKKEIESKQGKEDKEVLNKTLKAKLGQYVYERRALVDIVGLRSDLDPNNSPQKKEEKRKKNIERRNEIAKQKWAEEGKPLEEFVAPEIYTKKDNTEEENKRREKTETKNRKNLEKWVDNGNSPETFVPEQYVQREAGIGIEGTRLNKALSKTLGRPITNRELMAMFLGYKPIPPEFASQQMVMAMDQYYRNIKLAFKAYYAYKSLKKYAIQTDMSFMSVIDDYLSDIG